MRGRTPLVLSCLLILSGCDFYVTAENSRDEPKIQSADQNSFMIVSVSDSIVQLGKSVSITYKIGDQNDITVLKCNNTAKGQVEKRENGVWQDYLPEVCENAATEKFAKNNIYTDSFIFSETGSYRVVLVYFTETANSENVIYSDIFTVL